MTDICGFSPPDSPMVCISEPGHRGRHKLRRNGEEEPMKEMMMTDGGKVEAVVEMDHDAPAEVVTPILDDGMTSSWHPPADVFLNLKGKLYLPARRRVQWMRGTPEPHPDWTIDTMVVEHVIGKFIRPGRVEGGYGLVRANIRDESGRLIATGIKSEYSENFADYIEKAETGAIARALAIAGYGTESALDFDEGVDMDRIADAPVDPPAKPVMGKSEVPGVGRGGKTDGASVAQIRRVSELSRRLELGPSGLAAMVESVFAEKIPTLGSTETEQSLNLANFLAGMPGAKVGELISILEAAVETAD